MSDSQAQPGSSWRNHPPSERPRPAGGTASPGPWRCSAPRRHTKLLETERSSCVLSFQWKEEQLLQRQLGLLDAMKKREASARLTQQKALYRRCHAQLQRVELAHARLRGDRDLVQWLTGPSRRSYSSGPSDESGAAVRAIMQGRLGSEGGGLCPVSPPEAARHPPPTGGSQPGEGGARAAARGALQAEGPRRVLAVHARGRLEPAAQQTELPEGRRPVPQAVSAMSAGQSRPHDTDGDRSTGQSRPHDTDGDKGAGQSHPHKADGDRGTRQSHLHEADGDNRQPKGPLLLYGKNHPHDADGDRGAGQSHLHEANGARSARQSHLHEADGGNRRPKGQLLLHVIRGDRGAEQPKKARPGPKDRAGPGARADGAGAAEPSPRRRGVAWK